MFYDYSIQETKYYTCVGGTNNIFLTGPIVYDMVTNIIVQTPTFDQITGINEIINIDLSILITEPVSSWNNKFDNRNENN